MECQLFKEICRGLTGAKGCLSIVALDYCSVVKGLGPNICYFWTINGGNYL